MDNNMMEDIFEIASDAVITEETVIERRRFSMTRDPGNVLPEVSPNNEQELSRDIRTIRDTVLKMDSRLNSIENVLADKMPEKSEVLAQSKLIRECKVLTARTQKSIGRITGDIEDEEYLVLAAKLPMSSEEALSTVESLIQTRSSADSMMRLLVKAKGHKGNVDGVMRSLFGDTLIIDYNLGGRRGKQPLLKLKCIDLLFDAFPEIPKEQIIRDIRHYVMLSHNRLKQQKYKLKKKIVLSCKYSIFKMYIISFKL